MLSIDIDTLFNPVPTGFKLYKYSLELILELYLVGFINTLIST